MRITTWPTLIAGVILFCLLGCLLVPAETQSGITQSATAPVAAQPEAPKDSLGRNTPRGTVFAFLSAARKGDDEAAAQYLNTRLRGDDAERLAHELFVVLDRRLPAQLNQLSDKPEGSLSYPARPNQDLVGTIPSDTGDVNILVERVNHGNSGPLWLFSSKTLDSIPDLYEEVNQVPAETIIPEFLISTRIAQIPLIELLAVFLGMPFLYLLTGLLNRVISHLGRTFLTRICKKPDWGNAQFLPRPIRLLLLAYVIHWTTSKVSLPLAARVFWSSTTAVITITACVWLFISLISWAEELVRRRLQERNLAGATSILRFARGVIDLLAVFVGVLVALHHFGVNPTAALAGLGVGGIAVALAAQKTLEK